LLNKEKFLTGIGRN